MKTYTLELLGGELRDGREGRYGGRERGGGGGGEGTATPPTGREGQKNVKLTDPRLQWKPKSPLVTAADPWTPPRRAASASARLAGTVARTVPNESVEWARLRRAEILGIVTARLPAQPLLQVIE